MHEHELESPTKHDDMRLGEEWHDAARWGVARRGEARRTSLGFWIYYYYYFYQICGLGLIFASFELPVMGVGVPVDWSWWGLVDFELDFLVLCSGSCGLWVGFWLIHGGLGVSCGVAHNGFVGWLARVVVGFWSILVVLGCVLFFYFFTLS